MRRKKMNCGYHLLSLWIFEKRDNISKHWENFSLLRPERRQGTHHWVAEIKPCRHVVTLSGTWQWKAGSEVNKKYPLWDASLSQEADSKALQQHLAGNRATAKIAKLWRKRIAQWPYFDDAEVQDYCRTSPRKGREFQKWLVEFSFQPQNRLYLI